MAHDSLVAQRPGSPQPGSPRPSPDFPQFFVQQLELTMHMHRSASGLDVRHG